MFSFDQNRHTHDLALIKLQKTLPQFRVIEMCKENPASFDTHVIAVGVGSTSQSPLTPATSLREITLKTSPFQFIDSWLNFDFCPVGLVCTETTVRGSGLCHNDDGSPLFLRDCKTKKPICLLGIATPTLKDESPLIDCKGQADFTSIPHSKDWISTSIMSNQ